MKAKDVVITNGKEKYKLGSLSNNKKCALIIQLLHERNALKKRVDELSLTTQ